MDKRTKIKAIISTICLIVSVAALYAFVVIVDVTAGWRIALAVIAVGWAASGILNLIACFKQRK